MNIYVAGSLVEVATYTGPVSDPTGGFRDATGTLADPGVVTLTYRPGSGAQIVTVTYPAAPLVKDAVGLYHAALDTTATQGTWIYELSGTGGVQAAAANGFIVQNPFA